MDQRMLANDSVIHDHLVMPQYNHSTRHNSQTQIKSVLLHVHLAYWSMVKHDSSLHEVTDMICADKCQCNP